MSNNKQGNPGNKGDQTMIVRCRCGKNFELDKASWCKCGLHLTKTKECPNGHCICHKLHKVHQWRKPNKREKEAGFELMLKESYGGLKWKK